MEYFYFDSYKGEDVLFSISSNSSGFSLEVYEQSEYREYTKEEIEELNTSTAGDYRLERVPYQTPWGNIPFRLKTTIEFSLDELSQQRLICDQSYLVYQYGMTQANGWKNLTQDHFVTKKPFRLYYIENDMKNNNVTGRFAIIVPFKDSSDYSLVFYRNHEEHPILIDGSPISTSNKIEFSSAAEIISIKIKDNLLNGMQLMVPSTAAVGEVVDCEVKILKNGVPITNANCEVYLENIGGSLPMSRIQVYNGVGSFKLDTVGAISGQTIRVKAGWKYWSGEAEAIINVV